MYDFIQKIGGRKVCIILFASFVLMIGFFLMRSNLEHYQTFCAAIVSISTGFIVGNAMEHKYNNNIPQTPSE